MLPLEKGGDRSRSPLGQGGEVDTPSGLEHPGQPLCEPESRLADYLAEARALLADPPTPAAPPQGVVDLAVGESFGDLRWFLMPDEAARELAEERLPTR